MARFRRKSRHLDIPFIKDAARVNALRIARTLAPDGKIVGVEYVALNPTRNDKSLGSFKINFATGCWADFATNERGRDLISLVAYLCGFDYLDAAQWLLEFLELDEVS